MEEAFDCFTKGLSAPMTMPASNSLVCLQAKTRTTITCTSRTGGNGTSRRWCFGIAAVPPSSCGPLGKTHVLLEAPLLWKVTLIYLARAHSNEIPIRDTPEGADYSDQLTAYIHHLDPSSNRTVTSAIPHVTPSDDQYASYLDVVGYNCTSHSTCSECVRLSKRRLHELFAQLLHELFAQLLDVLFAQLLLAHAL